MNIIDKASCFSKFDNDNKGKIKLYKKVIICVNSRETNHLHELLNDICSCKNFDKLIKRNERKQNSFKPVFFYKINWMEFVKNPGQEF